jgi:hypothetical protein
MGQFEARGLDDSSNWTFINGESFSATDKRYFRAYGVRVGSTGGIVRTVNFNDGECDEIRYSISAKLLISNS